MAEPQTDADDRPRLGGVVSPGRLAFSVLAPPAAWSAQGLLGWFFASHACGHGGASWGPLPAEGVRLLLLATSLVALAVAFAAVSAGYSGWKRLSAAGPGGRMGESAEFLARVGMMIGTVLAIGIFWATLPSLLVHVCGEIR